VLKNFLKSCKAPHAQDVTTYWQFEVDNSPAKSYRTAHERVTSIGAFLKAHNVDLLPERGLVGNLCFGYCELEACVNNRFRRYACLDPRAVVVDVVGTFPKAQLFGIIAVMPAIPQMSCQSEYFR
jgi:hypothetical protein